MACVRKYRGYWVVDWRDPTTKKRAIEKADENTRESAKRRLKEILGTDEKIASKVSFQEYGTWWLENVAKGSIKDSTFQEYQAVLKKHAYPVLGSKQFAKVTRPMIRELIAAKKKEGLSQSTIRNIMAPVRGMFFQAIEDGRAHANPAARIGKLNKRAKEDPAKKINPLTRDEIRTMLETAREKMPHYYPLFLCAPRTGLRQGELISLKGADIDFKGQFICVQRNLSRGKISVTKNGKDRKVDMSEQLTEVLSELLSKRRAAALRKEMEKPAGERRDAAAVVNAVMADWLFTTVKTELKPNATKRAVMKGRGGTQLDPSNLRKVFNGLLTAAKLRRVRFHDLRHTFASLLIEQGEGLAYVKEQMGHSSINVTVDIYGHLVPGGNRQAVNKLDDDAPITKTVAAVQ